jgi:predicted ArsR family transcriptional regulator
VKEPLKERLEGIAALAEPLRRELYVYVVSQPEPVSRERAAAALAIAAHTAKFHLDRLVTDGLLEADYRRPPGRGGPGAGRPAKLYRRSARQVEVSLPERRYDLAGGLLAQAIEEATTHGVPVDRAVRKAARETGRRLGEAGRAMAGRRASKPRLREALSAALERNGYEPRERGDEVVLANCPFHGLAEEHRALVCGMNLDLLSGIIEGIGTPAPLVARLAPEPGYCCVRLALDEGPRPEPD